MSPMEQDAAPAMESAATLRELQAALGALTEMSDAELEAVADDWLTVEDRP